MIKKLICFLIGHNWEQLSEAKIFGTGATRKCKRCGEYNKTRFYKWYKL